MIMYCSLCRKNSEEQLLSAGTDSEEVTSREEVANKFCDVCKFLKLEKDAPKYCVECSKLLCVECASRHRETSISNKHRIICSTKTVPKQQTCTKHHPGKAYIRSIKKSHQIIISRRKSRYAFLNYGNLYLLNGYNISIVW